MVGKCLSDKKGSCGGLHGWKVCIDARWTTLQKSNWLQPDNSFNTALSKLSLTLPPSYLEWVHLCSLYCSLKHSFSTHPQFPVFCPGSHIYFDNTAKRLNCAGLKVLVNRELWQWAIKWMEHQSCHWWFHDGWGFVHEGRASCFRELFVCRKHHHTGSLSLWFESFVKCWCQLHLTDHWPSETKGWVNQVYCPEFNDKHMQELTEDFGWNFTE